MALVGVDHDVAILVSRFRLDETDTLMPGMHT
jgi:hypothetical protein